MRYTITYEAMFNFDFESPRFKSALRTIQYVFLTSFVVIGTIILVYAGQGYDINRRTGEVIQNGLLLINTTPEGSTVFINDQAEGDNTPGRFALPEGRYDIRLEQAGYLPWTKQVSVAGSSVEWLYYPRLIPSELVTQNVSALRSLEFAAQSVSGQQLLVRQKSTATTFNLMSLSDSTLTNDQTVTLPRSLLTLGAGKLGNFSFEGWSDDARHLLLMHQVGNRVEYVWLDIEVPAESINLTDEFDLDLRDVRFIDGQPELLYSLVDNDLRRINLSDDTISAPLVRDVTRYVLYEDRFVVYIHTDQADSGLQLGLLENGQPARVLAKLEGKAGRYRLEFAAFDDTFHLALLDTEAGQTKVMFNPHNDQPSEDNFTMPTTGASFLSFSRNGQYLTAQGDGKFYTHDLDRTRRHTFTLDFDLPKGYEAKWLDGNYLLAHDTKNMLYIFEFDGGNLHPIVQSDPAVEVFVDSDFETLYTFTAAGAASDRTFLQSTSLIAEP